MYYVSKRYYVGGKPWWSRGYEQSRGATPSDVFAYAVGKHDPFQGQTPVALRHVCSAIEDGFN